jgi:chemotaxis protein CheD
MTAALAARGERHRYWDQRYEAWTVAVVAGDVVTTDGDDHLTTVLGSCVATCVRDRTTGAGGMNHMLLPETNGRALVRSLLDRVLAYGGRRDDLEIKLFGGGRVLTGLNDVGQLNSDSVLTYLADQGLTVSVSDLGGTEARRLRYHPRTGQVLLQRLFVRSHLLEAP